MRDETSLRLLGIIAPLVISITALTLTQVYKLLSDLFEMKRRDKVYMLSVQHELMLNLKISEAIERTARTVGFEFVTHAWSSVEAAAIYRRHIPYSGILQVYSDIHLFNLLSKRRDLIQQDSSYGNKSDRLAIEHAEMISLNDSIRKNIEDVLKTLRSNRRRY